MNQIKALGEKIERIYFIYEKDGIELNSSPKGNVDSWSGFGGLIDGPVRKKVKIKMAQKAKNLNANVVLITYENKPGSNDGMKGVNIKGSAYKINCFDSQSIFNIS